MKKIKIGWYNIISIIFLCIAAFASVNSDKLNSIALYILLPVSALLVFLHNPISLHWSKFTYVEKILLFLYIFLGISFFWANYEKAALNELHRILGVVLLGAIIIMMSRNKKTILLLYGVYIFLYCSALYYASTKMAFDIYGTELDRLNDNNLNANTLAYYTFYTTCIIYILGELAKTKLLKIILRFSFLLILPLSFFIALITASRQVLIVQIPLFIILCYFRYLFNVSKFQKICLIIIFTITGIFAMNTFVSISDGSILASRSEKNIRDDSRSKLLKDAISVGNDHFLTGVGVGNYIEYSYNKHISHCTYTEFYANTGIISAILYIICILSFIKKQFRRYRKYHDKLFLTFLAFGIFFFFDNVMYVFYPDMWLMGFFILITSHSEIYYQNYLTTNRYY